MKKRVEKAVVVMMMVVVEEEKRWRLILAHIYLRCKTWTAAWLQMLLVLRRIMLFYVSYDILCTNYLQQADRECLTFQTECPQHACEVNFKFLKGFCEL